VTVRLDATGKEWCFIRENGNSVKLITKNAPIFAGFLASMLIGMAVQFFSVNDALDRKILDAQFEFLRAYYPQPVKNDVVIVGIDEQAFKSFREPFALWHPYLGTFLRAMAQGKPSVVGLDIVLPEYSYHFLLPQYDQSLLQGLITAKSEIPVVLGKTLDDSGAFRPIFPPYVSLAGRDEIGSVMFCLDGDGVARHFKENLCAENTETTTLAGRMAAHIGLHQSWQGLVDYSIGDPFSYVPFTQVLQWYTQKNETELKRVFKGKPVLLGAISPFDDRLNMPVAMAAWEPLNHRLPGVLLHGQVLRSMQAHGLIRDVSGILVMILSAVATLFWFGRGSWIKSGLFVIFFPGALLLSTSMLWQSRFFPVASILLAGTFAFLARMSYEAWRQMLERRQLRNTFGHYVSPQIMNEILSGSIKPGLGGTRKRVCVLFSDIRSFTARSEQLQPEEVIGLLNTYFSEMTASVHKYGGTLDKFIGDGLMAFFGAPQSLDCPEKNALESAQDMLMRLNEVNKRLQLQGMEPLRIGIGLHCGEVIVGHVGSESRNEYTAIGDVVNIASRLEGLTKTLKYPVICSSVVAEAVGHAGGLVDLGQQAVIGHSDIPVFGWNPPIVNQFVNTKEN
jgi:class 3 adenylate cyclase